MLAVAVAVRLESLSAVQCCLEVCRLELESSSAVYMYEPSQKGQSLGVCICYAIKF